MALENEIFIAVIYCLITRIICACDINVDALVTRNSAIGDKPLWTSRIDTVIACAQMCVRRKVCKSFNYDIVSKKCDLNDIVIGEADTLRHGGSDMYSEIAYWPSSIDMCCYGRPCTDSEVCIPGPLADGSSANDCKYACLKLSLVCPMPATGQLSGTREVGAVNTYPCPPGQIGDSAECLPSQKWSKELSTTCQQLYRYPCSSDSTCSAINGECSGGVCECKSGSSYVSARALCDCGTPPNVPNAGMIGSSFQQTYSCNDGYTQTAASVPTINCAASGWTPINSFQCYTCGTAPVEPNTSSAGNFQQKTYSCNAGYISTSGSDPTITCNENGQWLPANSFACYTCGTAPVVPNASLTGNIQQKTYSCNAGYITTSGSDPTITCNENGQWLPANSFACYSCGPVPPVPNAGYTGTNTQKTYVCNTHYYPTGSSIPTIVCDETTQQWTPANSFTCYTCGSVPYVDNSFVTGTDLQKNYTCNAGYHATAGSVATVNCQYNGQWTPTSFTCYTCGAAPSVPNAAATGTDLQKTYTCNADYHATASSVAIINCQENGLWTLVSFTCYTCGAAPSVPNAAATGNYLQKAYTCNAGYHATAGSVTIINCQETGQWTPANSFACYQCGAAPDVPNASLSGNSLLKTYTCHAGFTAAAGSNNTIRCAESGLWLPQNAFSCEAPLATNVRLRGSGDGITTGRLELFHNSEWVTVCRDDWEWEATQVVCKQLNPSHFGGSSQRHSPWGEGTGTSYKLHHLSCTGSESSIFDCSYTIQENHCGHDKDMGLTCYTSATLSLTDSVRLVDSGTGGPLDLTPTPSGKHRLEVKWGGVWGTVCGSPWEEDDTNVACRSLSTPLIGSDSCSDACDEEGTGPIYFGDVKCDGDEPHFFYCDNKGMVTSKCNSQSQTVALDCSG